MTKKEAMERLQIIIDHNGECGCAEMDAYCMSDCPIDKECDEIPHGDDSEKYLKAALKKKQSILKLDVWKEL